MIVPAMVPVDEAPDALFEAMWALYRPSHAVDLDTFARKTRQKFSDLVVLRDGGRVVGFFGGGPVEPLALPSGETVMTRYLGQAMVAPSLRRSGWSMVCPLLLGAAAVHRSGPRRTFLWQDCITVRTFLLAARHAPVTWPHPSVETPEEARFVRDAVARRAYGASYDPATGVVRKEKRLVLEADIDPRRLDDPLVAFYAARNPGYVYGDGLIQVFPMSWSMLARATGRTLLRGPLRGLLGAPLAGAIATHDRAPAGGGDGGAKR